MTSLAETMRQRAVVLDGGLASELQRHGYDVSTALWSAGLLIENPAAVRAAHLAFFAAGAEVATTASYQASAAGCAAVGVAFEPLVRRSVALAAEARDEHGAGWVAASIGPYGAALADGSEYRGDYGVGPGALSVAQLRTFHRPRLEILAEAGAEVFALETIPCLREVAALLAEVERIGIPAWLSLSAEGGRTRAGEALGEAYALAADCPSVIAVGVNCLAPAETAAAAALAAAVAGKPAVAYPNSGEDWDPVARDWRGPARFDAGLVDEWLDAGARLVGGCCRVTPEDIRAVAARASRPLDSGQRSAPAVCTAGAERASGAT